MFNFPRHLPELIAYGTGITAALRGKAGGRAGAQRRQIENDVKKNPAFFCFAAVTGYNSESGGKKSPVACFFARFSAAAGVIDNGGRSSH